MKPNGALEYMARSAWGGEMVYLGGVFAPPLRRWLDLAWEASDPGYVSVTARASSDKVNWFDLGPAVVIQWSYLMEVGLAVTSHDSSRLNTAHFEGALAAAAWRLERRHRQYGSDWQRGERSRPML
jgi:hypothetical protein